MGGKSDAEKCAGWFCGEDFDETVVCLCEPFYQCQAETCSGGFASLFRPATVELLENFFSLRVWNAGAVVFYLDEDVPAGGFCADGYSFVGGVAGVLDGVIDKVDDYLCYGVLVEGYFRQISEVGSYPEAGLACAWDEHAGSTTDGVIEIAESKAVFFPVFLDTGEIEDIFNQPTEAFAFTPHARIVFGDFFFRFHITLFEHFGVHSNTGKRSAELVRDGGDKIILFLLA